MAMLNNQMVCVSTWCLATEPPKTTRRARWFLVAQGTLILTEGDSAKVAVRCSAQRGKTGKLLSIGQS